MCYPLISYLSLFHISVVGEKERSRSTVNVRTRDNVIHGEISLEDITEKFKNIRDNYSNTEDI